MKRSAAGLLLFWGAATVACDGPTHMAPPDLAPVDVRIALFNIQELSVAKINEVDAAGVGTHPQLRAAADIIQTVRPDILVLNEVDHDYDLPGEPLTAAARAFARNYLATGEDPVVYPFAYAEPNNTGMLSGVDLNGDGRIAQDNDRGTREYGDDAFGFGTYPGQYSIAALSVHPFVSGEARTFQNLLWSDLPGNHLPVDFYSDEALAVLRLSSKSHHDVPLGVDGRRLHLFLSHPAPPTFDGDEDRNGRRNFDEIKLWLDYLNGAPGLVDDGGTAGGYQAGEPFVIVGDLNAAPDDAAVYDGVTAVDQLLMHTAVQDSGPWVVSAGAPGRDAGGPPAYPERATTEFGGRGRRIDYVLPSRGLEILAGGVYWPDTTDPAGRRRALLASDHRLVWLDIRIPGN